MSERLKIAICDDETRAVSIISASVTSIFAEHGIPVQLETFLHPGDLVERLMSRAFDLVFLDINMPGMDGVEMGKLLNSKASDTEIIFCSSQLDRVYDTFQVHPFGFVRKNRFMDDIAELISRYIEYRKTSANNDDETISFKDGQGIISINIQSLKYIESARNTQTLYFDGAEEPRRIYSSMDALEKALKEHDYIRIHKGFLVSCRYIKRIDAKGCDLTTGETLPVGRSYHRVAMESYLGYAQIHGNFF